MSHPPANPKPPTSPKPPKGAEELYPVSELAQLWRCSPDHVMDLVTRGELRSVQLGTGRAKTRIPASAAAEFIAKRSSKGRAA